MVQYLAKAIFESPIVAAAADQELTDKDVETVAGDMLDYINHNLEILVNEVYDEVFTLMLKDLWLVVRMFCATFEGNCSTGVVNRCWIRCKKSLRPPLRSSTTWTTYLRTSSLSFSVLSTTFESSSTKTETGWPRPSWSRTSSSAPWSCSR